ncbi:hypothetical protein O181_121748 [Austropuccinia psidii MF-1]|uniref:Uncharacterized protein n=1 Tax=Austropuccinia psidii MF-1 TaxID=1389203 RepID=A0A9Q3Q1J6_9BASI|nr:hypothetical protein [Austropuccinia psidii MF-1]
MCPANDASNLMIEDSIGEYDGEPIQEENKYMVNLLQLLNKKVEENNKNNAKTQAVTNKLLAAYEKMSHHIDSVLLQMETLEKKAAHQEKLINGNITYNKERNKKIPKGFSKAIIPNNKNNNTNKAIPDNPIDKPHETHAQNLKQLEQVGDYCKAL